MLRFIFKTFSIFPWNIYNFASYDLQHSPSVLYAPYLEGLGHSGQNMLWYCTFIHTELLFPHLCECVFDPSSWKLGVLPQSGPALAFHSSPKLNTRLSWMNELHTVWNMYLWMKCYTVLQYNSFFTLNALSDPLCFTVWKHYTRCFESALTYSILYVFSFAPEQTSECNF